MDTDKNRREKNALVENLTFGSLFFFEKELPIELPETVKI